MPGELTFQQIYLLFLLALALTLFITSWLRFDMTAVVVLTLLVLPGILGEPWQLVTKAEALGGFANESIAVLVCLFIIARALLRTGFSDAIAVELQRFAVGKEKYLFLVLLFLIAVCSAFVNNTAITAMAIPIVLRSSSRIGADPARLYLPLAYMSLVGGVMTLIGTTTNIAVSSVLELRPGCAPLGMFEMFPAGIIFTVVAGVVLFVVSPRLLADKPRESLFSKYKVKEFISEVLVKADSQVVGRPLQDLHFGHEYDLTIMGIVRDGRTVFTPPPSFVVRDDDVLLVQGGVEGIIALRKEKRLELVNELRVEQGTLRSLDLVMAEVVLMPNSTFIGRTPRDIDLRDHFGITILAFSRRGAQTVESIADTPLRMGDTLLVQGHVSGIERLQSYPNLLVLETLEHKLTYARLPVALAIVGALVVLSVFQTSWLFVNFVAAVLALLATRCVALRDIYDAVDWRIIVLIGCLIPLGTAIERSHLIRHVEPWLPRGNPILLLAGVYLTTFALTQVISNTVSATLMTPIAIDLAAGLGVDYRPLVLAVAFAASFAFVTPYGHQACTLVMGPGNYKLRDYARLGSVLGVVLFAVALLILPWLYPF